MNTLNKYMTSDFFNSEDGYQQLKSWWSAKINSDEKHQLTSTHHLLYAILRGKDWRKGFKPRLDEKGTYPEALNSAFGLNYPWRGLNRAGALDSFIASGIVCPDVEKRISLYFEQRFPEFMWSHGYLDPADDDDDGFVRATSEPSRLISYSYEGKLEGFLGDN